MAAPRVRAPAGHAVAAATEPPMPLRGNLQRDLLRLGIVPCAAVALALTAWFTLVIKSALIPFGP